MTTRHVRTAAAAVAVILTVFVALANPAAANPPPSDTAWGEARIIWLLNQERQMRGLQPLANNGGAHNVAQYSANVQAYYGRLGHNPNLGNDVSRNVDPNWWGIGENVGCGYDADNLHAMWMSSSGHRANALNPSFDTVGVGVAYARGCVWATVVFVDR